MVFFMASERRCLGLAVRTIPAGTAYAVWTGASIAVATLVGVFLFNEPTTVLRLGSIGLTPGHHRPAARRRGYEVEIAPRPCTSVGKAARVSKIAFERCRAAARRASRNGTRRRTPHSAGTGRVSARSPISPSPHHVGVMRIDDDALLVDHQHVHVEPFAAHRGDLEHRIGDRVGLRRDEDVPLLQDSRQRSRSKYSGLISSLPGASGIRWCRCASGRGSGSRSRGCGSRRRDGGAAIRSRIALVTLLRVTNRSRPQRTKSAASKTGSNSVRMLRICSPSAASEFGSKSSSVSCGFGAGSSARRGGNSP